MAAATDELGLVSFRIGHISHSGGNSLGKPQQTGDQVAVFQGICLDQILNAKALTQWPAMLRAYEQKSLVVKVDVEGFEPAVLNGMSELLAARRCRKVIVEVNPGRATELSQDANIDALMARYSYYPTINPAFSRHFDQCYLPTDP